MKGYTYRHAENEKIVTYPVTIYNADKLNVFTLIAERQKCQHIRECEYKYILQVDTPREFSEMSMVLLYFQQINK